MSDIRQLRVVQKPADPRPRDSISIMLCDKVRRRILDATPDPEVRLPTRAARRAVLIAVGLCPPIALPQEGRRGVVALWTSRVPPLPQWKVPEQPPDTSTEALSSQPKVSRFTSFCLTP